MKAKGKLICSLLVIDTFFAAFYLGFNSRSVAMVDPKLPPLVPKAEAKTKPAEAKDKPKTEKAQGHATGSGVKEKPAKGKTAKPHKKK